MLKIIALDPGVTTGYAEGVIDSGYMKTRCNQAVFTHLELYDYVAGQHPHHIICESFDFRKVGKGSQGANLFPRELIGVVNLYVEKMQKGGIAVEIVMQTPAKGKSYFDDDKLKEANLYEKSKPHGRDALRHLLQWYEFGPGYKYNKKGFGPWNLET